MSWSRLTQSNCSFRGPILDEFCGFLGYRPGHREIAGGHERPGWTNFRTNSQHVLAVGGSTLRRRFHREQLLLRLDDAAQYLVPLK